MPFKKIDNLHIIGPNFMMIDYFRLMSDPLTSYWRLEKTFNRFILLANLYPLPSPTTNISIQAPEKELDIAFSLVHEFLLDKQSAVVTGMYQYNYFVKESEIYKTDKNIKFSDINYYEIISCNYFNDANELLDKLYDKFNLIDKNIISYEEFYPFFQYLGYSVHIYCKKELIAIIYDHNNRCSPFKKVPALYFRSNSFNDNKKHINLASYSVFMMYCLINVMKARTNYDEYTKNMYYTLIAHSINMKNFYLKTNKKCIF